VEVGPADAQEAAQGDRGRAEEDEDMEDLVDYFIGGNWAPQPWSSNFFDLYLCLFTALY